MYATDSDGCPSRGCWNFLPIASKLVRKIGREGEAESYTWQRRGRDKRHKDKTNTLFMRRNNQRHRFARRRRAALQPARQPGGYQIQTLLRYSPSLLIDSSFSRIHIVMLLQLPACLPEREREKRERESFAISSFLCRSSKSAKQTQNFATRFQTEIARMSSALPSIFNRIFFIEKCTERDRETESARESNRPCTSFDVQQNFLQRERNRGLGVAALHAICNLLLCFLPP